MKKFLAIYLGSASAIVKWKEMPEAKRKTLEATGIQAWGKWATANEKVIVDQGSPLGKTKRISAQGVLDTKNEIAAYTIVEAESHEAAAKNVRKSSALHDLSRSLSRSHGMPADAGQVTQHESGETHDLPRKLPLQANRL